MPHHFEYPHVIHPATLDAVLQMVLPSLLDDEESSNRAFVPQFVKGIYVSNNTSTQAGGQIRGHSQITAHGLKRVVGTITASSTNSDDSEIIIEDISLAPITANGGEDIQSNVLSILESQPHWDIDIASTTIQRLDLASLGPVTSCPRQTIQDLEFAAFIFCKRALQKLKTLPVEEVQPRQRLYWEYLQTQMCLASQSNLPLQENRWLCSSEAEEEELLERVATSSTDGQLLCRVGPVIDQVLFGKLEPLQVMTGGSLLTNYYQKLLGFDQLRPYIERIAQILSHKRPLRVLEIGAGAGRATRNTLSAFGQVEDARSRLHSYTYTDISDRYFVEACADHEEWKAFMKYKIMDIEVDPAQQGFAMGSYDLVVCHNVFHTTSSIDLALANCRRLLAP